MLSFICPDGDAGDTCILDLIKDIGCEDCLSLCYDLTCKGINNIFSKYSTVYTAL